MDGISCFSHSIQPYILSIKQNAVHAQAIHSSLEHSSVCNSIVCSLDPFSISSQWVKNYKKNPWKIVSFDKCSYQLEN